MHFIDLAIGDDVPDEKTIWLLKEQLAEAGLTEKLFERFDSFLRDSGFQARKGQIVDASIISVPKQRNTRKENKRIKAEETVEEWSEKKACQKDTEARWVKKNGVNFFGYKNHIQIDAKHKFVRAYEVTNAAVHDSQIFEELLDEENTSRSVWADSPIPFKKDDRLT